MLEKFNLKLLVLQSLKGIHSETLLREKNIVSAKMTMIKFKLNLEKKGVSCFRLVLYSLKI